MPMTEALRASVLGKTLVATDFATATGWEVALFYGDAGLPTGNPTQEVTNLGYQRLPVTWTPPADSQVANIEQLEWTPFESWDVVRFVGVYETDGGTLQYYGPLNTPVIPVPPEILVIAPGNLAVAIDFEPGESVRSFLDLEDTPSAYTDKAGQLLKVSDTESGLIFLPVDNITLPLHADTHGLNGTDPVIIDWAQLESVPSAFPPDIHATTHSVGGGDPVNHNTLLNYVDTQHVDHSLVEIVAGTGLVGGGFITSDVTIDLDGLPVPTPVPADDWTLFSEGNLPVWKDTSPYYATANDSQTGYLFDTTFQVMELAQAVFDTPGGQVDLVTNTVNIIAPGLYAFSYNMQMDVPGAATVEMGFFDNGVEVPVFRQTAALSNAQDSVAFGVTFYASFDSGESVDVRGRVTAGTSSVTVQEYTLSIARIGIGI